MNDPIERLCTENLRYFTEECAKHIQRIKKRKRQRQWAASAIAVVFLLLAAVHFYQLLYWSGIFDSAEALLLAALYWKIWTRPIENARFLKMLAAQHKITVQNDLDRYHKERGF